jgi:hypothetical protein
MITLDLAVEASIAERVAGLYLLKGKPVFLWNLLDLKRDGVRGKVFSRWPRPY